MKNLTELHSALEASRPKALNLLQELVRIPSITGDETKIQSRLADHFREMGLECDVWNPQRSDLESHPAFSDDGLPLGDRPVVVARWPGGDRSGRSLILNGHVDVVPLGELNTWTEDPWSGSLRDGKVWGRGSCDMKGGLVAGITAVHALRQIGFAPAGDICIESVIGEETGGAGTLAAVLRGYRADGAIILEPTSLDLCPAGAGAASFRIHTKGRAAHGALREEGVSAIEKFYVVHQEIHHLEQRRNERFNDPLWAKGRLVAPISIGKLQSGEWPSTVPDMLIAEGRYGVLPGETLSEARSEFEEAIQSAANRDPFLTQNPPVIEWFEGQFEPARTPLESPLIQLLAQAHETEVGQQAVIRGVPYGSDLRFFTNHANMPAVLYGPGDVAVAHSANECVSFEEVMMVASVVASTIIHWCGRSPQRSL